MIMELSMVVGILKDVKVLILEKKKKSQNENLSDKNDDSSK